MMKINDNDDGDDNGNVDDNNDDDYQEDYDFYRVENIINPLHNC